MKLQRTLSRGVAAFLTLGMAFSTGFADAEPRWERGKEKPPKISRDDDYILHRGRPYVVRPDRIRRYHDIIVIRPYGHHYRGYGHYYSDADAYQWLAFAAITLVILNEMNEAQQRAYEQAQIEATRAPIGEKIIWNEGEARGSVTAIRDGVSTAGRYCREFQQIVTIGGKKEEAYGTACQRPDGSWEVVSTSDDR